MRAPSRPSIRWTLGGSVAALALAGGALATVAVDPLVEGFLAPVYSLDTIEPRVSAYKHGTYLAVVALSTTLLLAVALVLSIRARSRPNGQAIGWCTLFGWLNAGTSLAVGTSLLEGIEEGPRALISGLLLGLFCAAPLGLLYGLASLHALGRLRRLRDRPNLAMRVEAQLAVGKTVLGAGAFAMGAQLLGYQVLMPLAVSIGVTALGATVLGQAMFRLRRIRSLAADPTAHGYERFSLERLDLDASALWPLHAGVSEDAKFALVRPLPAQGDGGYRTMSARAPIALVD